MNSKSKTIWFVVILIVLILGAVFLWTNQRGQTKVSADVSTTCDTSTYVDLDSANATTCGDNEEYKCTCVEKPVASPTATQSSEADYETTLDQGWNSVTFPVRAGTLELSTNKDTNTLSGVYYNLLGYNKMSNGFIQPWSGGWNQIDMNNQSALSNTENIGPMRGYLLYAYSSNQKLYIKGTKLDPSEVSYNAKTNKNQKNTMYSFGTPCSEQISLDKVKLTVANLDDTDNIVDSSWTDVNFAEAIDMGAIASKTLNFSKGGFSNGSVSIYPTKDYSSTYLNPFVAYRLNINPGWAIRMDFECSQ